MSLHPVRLLHIAIFCTLLASSLWSVHGLGNTIAHKPSSVESKVGTLSSSIFGEDYLREVESLLRDTYGGMLAMSRTHSDSFCAVREVEFFRRMISDFDHRHADDEALFLDDAELESHVSGDTGKDFALHYRESDANETDYNRRKARALVLLIKEQFRALDEVHTTYVKPHLTRFSQIRELSKQESIYTDTPCSTQAGCDRLEMLVNLCTAIRGGSHFAYEIFVKSIYYISQHRPALRFSHNHTGTVRIFRGRCSPFDGDGGKKQSFSAYEYDTRNMHLPLMKNLEKQLKLLVNKAFLADVDTVEELPDVLVPDQGALVDERSRPADALYVHTGEDDLILDGVGLLDFNAWQHLDNPDALLSQEVPDFNRLSVISDVRVDGKVRVYKPHLVLVLLGDTRDHVVDVCHDGPDGGDHGLSPEPLHQDDGPPVLGEPDLDGDVREVAGEVAILALDGDLARLDSDGDCVLC
ncbi:membrane protein, putative [Babesia ovata]|uniref:Membrane protein, putative n=1 Tax=Babesia ovata TaxID=189622 RepID=A0A2H6K9D6_9APIC|nr:uncharacterized protein BOVATA_011000 [Babesia ovata]GBE59607.1 membrane protein, putative [Babesia ovata]